MWSGQTAAEAADCGDSCLPSPDTYLVDLRIRREIAEKKLPLRYRLRHFPCKGYSIEILQNAGRIIVDVIVKRFALQ